MIKRVANFLKEHKLQDKTVIVGFSGGYDSFYPRLKIYRNL